MDIKSTSTVTQASETSTSTSSSSAAAKDSKANFKDELEAVKTQDLKESEKNAKTAEATDTKKNEEEKAAQQLKKDQLNSEKDKNIEVFDKTKISNPLNELNFKIAAINEMKNGHNSKTQEIDSKIDDKQDYCQRIKMDNNDLTFFVNLVQNQQMIAQGGQVNNSNINNYFTDIKSEATQKTVHVSATLLDAINESAKTNKPFRIDFDNNIAVVMKVDKDGILSANFIPGSAAVEAYLKNNIESLKQNFDNQNLPYNELSYSKQQKQEQDQQQNKNKENKNE